MEKLCPRAVIFDLGSTLIEYETIPWEQLVLVCAEAAHDFLLTESIKLPSRNEFLEQFETTRLEYRARAVESLSEYTVPEAAVTILDNLQIAHNADLINRMFDAYYHPVRQGLYIYDDTFATLQKIKNAGMTIGLISNTIFPARTHLGELNRFGISEFFDFTIFSSTFGKRKPHPDIFKEALKQAGCEASEAVYVGDRYIEDVTGPIALGMSAILKPKKGREYPAEMPLAERRIDTLAELADHIDFG
ncbi:MAG: HAD family hydrolase [bacterium]|nr:HAD family hydrolase [bacterium]